MSEIKVKPKGTIKKLEKEIVQVQKFKNNLITVKEKANEISTNDNNTAENYASQKMKDRLNDYYGSRYELRNQSEAVEGRVSNMLSKLQHMYAL